MASVRKRGNAQWEARIRRRGWPIQCCTFETRAKAEAWARKVESDMDRGAFVSLTESEQTTFADALDRYWREVASTKDSTSRAKSQIKLLTNALGPYSLAALTSSVLAEFRDERLEETSAGTVAKDLGFIRRLLNIAMKEWGIALPHGNPVSQISMPKVSDCRDRRLLPGEEALLLSAARAYEATRKDTGPIEAVIRFAIATAMRRGEIAAMLWQDVDLQQRTLFIPKSKNGLARKIPLSSVAVAILELIPRRIVVDAEGNRRVDDNVWGIRADSISQAFSRIVERGRATYEKKCEEEGGEPELKLLMDLRFHDLRHEATSLLFERGLGGMEVAAITGHKTLSMLKRYTHLRAEDLVAKLA